MKNTIVMMLLLLLTVACVPRDTELVCESKTDNKNEVLSFSINQKDLAHAILDDRKFMQRGGIVYDSVAVHHFEIIGTDARIMTATQIVYYAEYTVYYRRCKRVPVQNKN